MSRRRFGGTDCCPLARVRYALSMSLRDNSTRSLKRRLPNSRELARDSSSRDMAFPMWSRRSMAPNNAHLQGGPRY